MAFNYDFDFYRDIPSYVVNALHDSILFNTETKEYYVIIGRANFNTNGQLTLSSTVGSPRVYKFVDEKAVEIGSQFPYKVNNGYWDGVTNGWYFISAAADSVLTFANGSHFSLVNTPVINVVTTTTSTTTTIITTTTHKVTTTTVPYVVKDGAFKGMSSADFFSVVEPYKFLLPIVIIVIVLLIGFRKAWNWLKGNVKGS